jgi:hypothetical protein
VSNLPLPRPDGQRNGIDLLTDYAGPSPVEKLQRSQYITDYIEAITFLLPEHAKQQAVNIQELNKEYVAVQQSIGFHILNHYSVESAEIKELMEIGSQLQREIGRYQIFNVA